MTTIWNDIKYGLRMLAKTPSFTATVVAILALGIGANTVVFSVVNAVLFRPLPYHEPDRIVRIWEQRKKEGIERIGSAHGTLLYWREHNQLFECIAGMQNRRVYLTGADGAYHIKAAAVSSCFFSLMGVQAMLGRGFLPEEEQPGHEAVVVLSHPFWRDRMGGDPQVIGRPLTLDGKGYTIVGVMPPDFRESLSRDVPFWVPLVLDPHGVGGGTGVRARLRPGVTLEQARAHMTALEERLVQMYPEYYAGFTVTVARFLDDEIGDNRTLLYLLWGAVGLVLLVACTNAASLFLTHGNVRHREMALRVALGATRGRLMRQMLTEGLLLSLGAGLVGLLLAFWVVKGLIRVCPLEVPRMNEARVDTSVLLLCLGTSVVTGLAFSLMPAWKAVNVHLSETLKGTSMGLSTGRRGGRLGGGLVIAQVAVALTLLMAVGLLIQSLISMQKVDLGFRPENVLVADVELPTAKYPSDPQWTAFFRQLLGRVQSLPDVRSAAVVSGGLDLGSGGGFMQFSIDGRPPVDPREQPIARYEDVSSDFFETLGMRIVKGRGFTDQDGQGTVKAILIDENLAHRYFHDVDPLGQRIDGMPIVGVVSTIRDFEALTPTINTIYKPLSEYCYQVSDLVVRTQGDPSRLADALRAQVSALDKDQRISEIRTLEAGLAEMLAPRRFTTVLLGVFAEIALVLAALGLYGLVQYTVTQCTKEIGIRMALGATQASITKAILYRSALLILLGTGLGLVGGFAVSRLMASQLYQSKPSDPSVLVGTVATLSIVALVACYLPARRAARIDPMKALRCE